ncbi:hypothetical protein [Aestuariirhabdus sp. LZHN29]|uniref:hypothetical protein n=1 Tax=Aestuariirhabdus sp. LZHN29 TaxID=3417462 RepID=UPI003CEC984F
MNRKVTALLTLLAFCVSAEALSDKRSLVGSVINITGSEQGVRFEMNAGVPAVCAQGGSQEMLIERDNIPAMIVIASSLMARFVSVTADYDPNRKLCIARSVTME